LFPYLEVAPFDEKHKTKLAVLTLRVHSSGDTVTPPKGGSISPNNKRRFIMQLDTLVNTPEPVGVRMAETGDRFRAASHQY